MGTSHSEQRVELAKRVVEVYAGNKDLVGAGICGSVARGTADAASDLDLYLFWDTPQTGAFKSSPLEAIGGDRFTFLPIDDLGDGLEQLFVDGIKVDIGHQTAAAQAELTRQSLDELDISAETFKNLSAISLLEPIHGAPLVTRLRDQARAYPDGLVEKVLSMFLQFPPPSLLRLCRDRNDTLGFADVAVRIAGATLACVAALNRQYLHPEAELKGAMRVLDRCKHQPVGLPDALLGLFAGPESNPFDALEASLGELIDQIESDWPNVETERARFLLEFQFKGA